MDLITLGWDVGVERDFQPYAGTGWQAGRVAVEQKGLYRVYTERGDLPARITGRMWHAAKGRADFPAVGDWVVLEQATAVAEPAIQVILPRKSKLSRKVAGKTTDEQILATNIDNALIVVGLDGDFNLRRIERYLTIIRESGANPVILLNKVDICDNPGEKLAQARGVAGGGPVYLISARTGEGMGEPVTYLQTGQTAVLLGSSGAGKSTLINNLLGYERNRTQAVREDDSHGRHTTTYRELIVLPGGGCLIDSPGLREIQVWDGAGSIGETFEEVERLARRCRFADCRHGDEPGCAVKEALESGRLNPARFENYLKLRREQAYIVRLQDRNEMMSDKEKWKNIAKKIKAIKKAQNE
jgi:ribosome biogenesis GTPase